MTRKTWMLVTMLAGLGAGCGDKAASCEEEAAHQCDGDVLQVCSDGTWEDEQDCAADGMMCHAEGGHCMEMADDSGM
jgi:hypothetical protein